MSETDQLTALLARIARGDREAFASFYDETSAFVFGLLRRMLEDRREAEEVAQEVYTQIWRTAPSYDPGRSSPLSWVALLARSRALDRTRSEGSYADAMDELEERSGTDALATRFPDPAEAATLVERRERVRAALSELPDAQRRAVEQAFFGGLTHREIAERDDTPLGTVKSRIRSGLQKLEDRLAPALAPDEGGGR